MAIRKLITAAFALCAPIAAQAFEGEQSNLTVRAQSIYNVSVPVEYDVKWKLSLLMGEPTRNLQIRWRLSRWAAMRLGDEAAIEGVSDNFLISKLPPDIRDTIRLYDVKVHMGFAGASVGHDCNAYNTAAFPDGFMILDAGAPTKQGEDWSFNVTGSPDWAKFMTHIQGANLTEEEAKAVMSQPELCGDVQDLKVTAKITLGDALRWMRKTYDKKPTRELIAGAERQLTVLSDILELPVEGPEREFSQLRANLQNVQTPDDIRDLRQTVEAAAQKLSDGIPARYVPDDKAADYQQAREEITRQVELILAGLVPDESAYSAELAAYELWSHQMTSDLEEMRAAISHLDRELKTAKLFPKGSFLPKTICYECDLSETYDIDGLIVQADWTAIYKFGDRYLHVHYPNTPDSFPNDRLKLTLFDLNGTQLDTWTDSGTGYLTTAKGRNHLIGPNGREKKKYNEMRYVNTEYAFVDGKWRAFFTSHFNGILASVVIGDGLEVTKFPSFRDSAAGSMEVSVQGNTLITAAVGSRNGRNPPQIPLMYEVDIQTGAYQEILPGESWYFRYKGQRLPLQEESFHVRRYNSQRYIVGGRSPSWTDVRGSSYLVFENGQQQLDVDFAPEFDPNGVVVGLRQGVLNRWLDGAWQSLDPKYDLQDGLIFYKDGAETVFIDAMENELLRAKGKWVGTNNAYIYFAPEQ